MGFICIRAPSFGWTSRQRGFRRIRLLFDLLWQVIFGSVSLQCLQIAAPLQATVSHQTDVMLLIIHAAYTFIHSFICTHANEVRLVILILQTFAWLGLLFISSLLSFFKETAHTFFCLILFYIYTHVCGLGCNCSNIHQTLSCSLYTMRLPYYLIPKVRSPYVHLLVLPRVQSQSRP